MFIKYEDVCNQCQTPFTLFVDDSLTEDEPSFCPFCGVAMAIEEEEED